MGREILGTLSDEKIIDQVCKNAGVSYADAKKALEILTVALGSREAALKALANAGSNIGAILNSGGATSSSPSLNSSSKTTPAKKTSSQSSSSAKKHVSTINRQEVVESYRSEKASWIVKFFMTIFGGPEKEKSQTDNQNLKKNSASTPEQPKPVAKPAPAPKAPTAPKKEVKKESDKSNYDIRSVQRKEILAELEYEQFKLTNFLQIVLKVLRIQKVALTSYARFGVGMMGVGAVELLKSTRQFGEDAHKALIVSLMILLGLDKDSAEEFYTKIDEYQLDRQNSYMIQVGTDGLQIYLNEPNSPSLVTLIQTSIQKWLSPNNETTTNTGIITVMFTDIVNSTSTTHKFGDQAAQEMVRVHNAIVRRALMAYNGKEVKHTGDGIMASFIWTTNAIDATISIQKAILKYNAGNPKIPLHVRIGLNSGEPIVEDEDLFGSTVQMSARVCAQANAEQIFVSNVVKELATSKSFTFEDRGLFSLKGIQGEQRLFEVIWNDKKEDSSEQENDVEPEKEEKTEASDKKEEKLSKVLPEMY
ncbi:MAG: adenylate/guanylate cyclase domain-containing protein [Alphaproteobacteria bacterium]|nr:adenylate/guanylate cyclase domain-containing protein [Alphaproteobacteria bacterium]